MIELGWSRYYINKALQHHPAVFQVVRSGGIRPGERRRRSQDRRRDSRRAARPLGRRLRSGRLPIEHVDAVLPDVSELVADVVQVMRLTGMRPGEVLSMTAAEIDRTDPTLWVFARSAQDRAPRTRPDRLHWTQRASRSFGAYL